MTILDAIRDPNLFRPFLGDDLGTWRPWLTALRVLYGLPISSAAGRARVLDCTGRNADGLPGCGFQTALFLTGRRSGKSRMAAVVGAYEAVLAGHERKLARGERGIVAVFAPTRRQAKVVKDYLRAVFGTPLLAAEVASETQWGFDLASGVAVEVMAGHYRTARGPTLLAAIVDEAAFFGLEADSQVRSDTELIRAVRPGLATTGGKLVAISSPYARRGWCFDQFCRHHGAEGGRALVWRAPSRVMNPTLPESVVEDALAEDYQAARSEYLAEFREDVAAFIGREVVDGLVVRGRRDLPPVAGVTYTAFADLSGGRGDDAALAVGHRAGRTVVVDLLRRYRPPFNPQAVIALMAGEVRRYGVRKVTGDRYGGEFTAKAFEGCGVRYVPHPKPKAGLYAELLPRLCSGEIELPDDPALAGQLAALERRVRSGGRDLIDHPPGGHDDLANAVAGLADVAVRVKRIGAMRSRFAVADLTR